MAVEIHGVKIRKSSDGCFADQLDERGGQVKSIKLTKAVRRAETAMRLKIQKSLYDINLNIAPAVSTQDLVDLGEVEGLPRLMAEETALIDRFDGLYQAFQILHPPVDPRALVHLSQRSPSMYPLVRTMVDNTVGFGQSYIPTIDLDDEAIRKDLEAHFAGQILQELEQDGIIRIITATKKRSKLAKSKSKPDPETFEVLAEELLFKALPTLEFRPPEPDEKETFIKVLKGEVSGFATENRERLAKLRERTFSSRIKALKAKQADELRFLQNFFENCNPNESWMQISKKRAEDYERIGASTLEIVRNPETRQPFRLGHIPYVDMRMTRLGPPIKVPTIQRRNWIEIVEVEDIVRFRKYVQSLGSGDFVWFKDFGDPRIMDSRSGVYVGEYRYDPLRKRYERVFFRDGDKKKEISEAEFLRQNPGFMEANEVLYRGLYNAIGSPYAVPRWFGCLTLVQGMIAMEEVNALWFDNNLIPPIVVMVTDTSLNTKSHERIKSFFEVRRGRENRDSVLVLEGQPAGQAMNFVNTGKPTIKIEKLRDAIDNDATHVKYDEVGRLKVRSNWRLPPAHIGQESQYTRQSVNASNVFAEKQVFRPEREDSDDYHNKRLLPALGVSMWKLKTNGPPVADNLELANILSILGKSGFLPVGEARPEIEAILNRPIKGLEDDKLYTEPFPLILIETKTKQNPNAGGPQDDAPENPQNRMGARPDKDGFVTDSEVLKSLHVQTGIRLRKVARVPFEEADDKMFELCKSHGGVFVQEESGELYFVVKTAGGLQSFKRHDERTRTA